ncbi:DUF397 domain-containing protein [Streptomyces sp. NPDC006798]|uniref:DUF397 domain-containing protein n=1 Tax=Streptomyces sp. NPDC006798 TaxID=3155462 RepID=UPI0033EA6CD5
MSDTPGLAWFKSSYSSAQGDDCIEIAWSKSSYSSPDGDNCIEVHASTAAVHVRDSKDIARPHFTVGPTAWTQFIGYASHG